MTLDSETLTKIKELQKYVQVKGDKTFNLKVGTPYELKFNLKNSAYDTKKSKVVFMVQDLHGYPGFEQRLAVGRRAARHILNYIEEHGTTELAITRSGNRGRGAGNIDTYSVNKIDYTAPVVIGNHP
jgi:hypothetical protein